MRPHPTRVKQTANGFSVTELLLVIAMVSVIAGFAAFSLFRGNHTVDRTNTAVEIARYLQRARVDSIRRRAKDVDQMAQVKVFNRRSYSLAIDADGDNQLDIPLVMNLPADKGIEMNGPFPKTFIFDGSGQTVDSLNHPVTPDPVTLSNSAGASAIKFSETGDVVVVPAVKLTAKK
jgi:prepilin-type N-terminal cleavage/methylation domain-containing protein